MIFEFKNKRKNIRKNKTSFDKYTKLVNKTLAHAIKITG